jgi:hypothetical protein
MALVRSGAPPSQSGWRGRRASVAGLLAAVLALGPLSPCRGQSELQIAEYRVKAAFLYKFASYVEWPPQVFARPDSPLVIGVAGSDTLADELAQMVAGRTVERHPVVVRKLHRGDPVDGVHILFIGRSNGSRLSDVLASARSMPVLTVTESEDAFALGSVINFVVVDDKVRFDVALREAEQAKLKVSSRLLAVARKVLGAPS